jgi:GTPase-associated protein 1, N-terminal domain type 2/GTPase-associated protein 1, middle domain
MAHQLQYTSAPTGLEDRAGFQFVASSRDGMTHQHLVMPLLAYRPPPTAPARPTSGEMQQLPIGFSYQRDGDNLLLVHCRYVGVDYSGRYGNFFGHAVIAKRSELGGLRPIELWRSPLWRAFSTGPSMPELEDLPAGPTVSPEEVLSFLGGRGEPAYPLLAALLDAVLAALDGRGGQVILVSDKVDSIARWIAAVCFSMPQPDALELSFVTYTADPDRARQIVVGTTSDALAGLRADAVVFEVDRPSASGQRSRYAEAVAAEWRLGRLDHLDELLELLALDDSRDPSARDAAAASLALSRGQLSFGPGSTAPNGLDEHVAALLERNADRLPPSLVDGLAEQPGSALGVLIARSLYRAAVRTGRSSLADEVGAEWVALALHDRDRRPRPDVQAVGTQHRQAITAEAAAALRDVVDGDDLVRVLHIVRDQSLEVEPADLRYGASRAARSGRGDFAAAYELAPEEALLDGIVDGLVGADGSHLRAVLVRALCDQMVDRDWTTAGLVGAYVLTSYGRRHPDQRVAITETLVDLTDRAALAEADLDRYMQPLWEQGPPTVAECLRLVGPDGVLSAAGRRRPAVVALARTALSTADVRRGDTAQLAYSLVTAIGGADPALADAEAVMALRDMNDGALDAGYARFEAVRTTASREIARDVARDAQAFFLAAPASQQAAALLRLPPGTPLRRELVAALLRQQLTNVDLAEIAVRLWKGGSPENRLIAEVVSRTKDQFRAIDVHNGLRLRSRHLAEDFDTMRADVRRTGLLSRFKRG